MTRSRLLTLFAILALGSVAITATRTDQVPSSPKPPGTNYKSPAFTFNKITDGVYHAVGTGSLVVMSNAAIVEGDRDVLVVDSHVTPGGAWALREELKAITPKPIRWVVNSHYHFDHSHGNQIYGPEVEIIGHEFARAQILAGKSQDSPAREFFVGGVPNTIKTLEGRLAAATDDKERSDRSRTARNSAESSRRHQRGQADATDDDAEQDDDAASAAAARFASCSSAAATPPATSSSICRRSASSRRATCWSRHVVHGRCVLPEWIETIETLKQLDFDTVLPGHGAAFKGKAKLDHWQAYLRDFWEQAQKFHKAGTPWEEAAKLVDLRGQAVNYPRSAPPASRRITACAGRTRFWMAK